MVIYKINTIYYYRYIYCFYITRMMITLEESTQLIEPSFG